MKHETKVQRKEGLRLTKGKHITPLIWKYAYMTETDLLLYVENETLTCGSTRPWPGHNRTEIMR